MSGWDGHGFGPGPQYEPREDDGGQAARTAEEGSPEPLWASAETRTATPLPPPSPPPAWGTVPPASPPPYAPPVPPPRPAGAHRAGRLLAAGAAAAVLGAGAGAGVWYVMLRDGSTPPAAGPPTSVSVTTTPPPAVPSPREGAAGDGTAETGPAQEASAPAGTAPAPGYRRSHDPVGYTVDVPEGWTRRQKQGEKAPVVFYDSPSDGRQLQIFEVTEDTPATSLDLAENDAGYGFARQPDYQALDRDSGPTWAELTYRYDDRDKGARQVVDHRFQAADGTLYAVRVSGPVSLSARLVRAPLTVAVTSFCPPGGQCG